MDTSRRQYASLQAGSGIAAILVVPMHAAGALRIFLGERDTYGTSSDLFGGASLPGCGCAPCSDSHTSGFSTVSERLDRSFKYWETGAAGVDLFFVISGFVMVYSSVNLISGILKAG